MIGIGRRFCCGPACQGADTVVGVWPRWWSDTLRMGLIEAIGHWLAARSHITQRSPVPGCYGIDLRNIKPRRYNQADTTGWSASPTKKPLQPVGCKGFRPRGIRQWMRLPC